MIKIWITVFLLLTIPSFNSNILACYCYELNSVEEEYKSATIVIYGEIITKEFVTLKETMNNKRLNEIKDSIPEDKYFLLNTTPLVVKVNMKIKNNYKGIFSSDTVTIYTARSGVSCGYRDFEVGEHFIIYGYKKTFLYNVLLMVNNSLVEDLDKKETYWTDQCTRTTNYYEEDKLILDEMSNNQE